MKLPDGITTKENLIFYFLLLFPKTIALELVEVNPCLDDKNKMAEVALDILEHIVDVLEQK